MIGGYFKRWVVILLCGFLIVLVMVLAGCSGLPKMTQEEIDLRISRMQSACLPEAPYSVGLITNSGNKPVTNNEIQKILVDPKWPQFIYEFCESTAVENCEAHSGEVRTEQLAFKACFSRLEEEAERWDKEMAAAEKQQRKAAILGLYLGTMQQRQPINCVNNGFGVQCR